MQVLIVEDEAAAARRLEKMLLEVAPDDLTVLARLDSVAATVEWLQQHQAPDLMLLDIHLADGASFEIFEHVQVSCPIIFTTAYDEYAVQAFKVNAVDYLLKPLKVNELSAAIDKYRRVFAPASSAPAADYTNLLDTLRRQSNTYLQRMLVRLGNNLKLVDLSDAAYFYTRDKITFLVVRSTGKRYPIDYPLDRLETLLDPRVFFRINRQFIINVAAIREMQPSTKSRVRVILDPASDQETVVSAERSAEFKRWLVGE